jgi:cytidyltransferase-like protein
MKVVAVSGGFDPVHIGHVRMFENTKKIGDKLVVILNNDHWLKKKKGYAFMPQEERAEIIKALRCVDDVLISFHKENDPDRSVCKELAFLKPTIFANGGDRFLDNIPEVATCKEHNIAMVFNIGGEKVQSSSDLVKKSLERS